MIFSERKLIFIHVPKTGGNYVTRAFVDTSDDEMHIGARHDGKDRFEIRGPLTKYKHQTLAEYAALMGKDLGAFTVVAFARPPLDRLLSLYYSPHRWLVEHEDGSFALDPDRDMPFVLKDFRILLREEPSLLEMLDIDNISGPLTVGGRAVHASGATVRLLDFHRLREETVAIAEAFGLPADKIPEKRVNRSARGDRQKPGLVTRALAYYHVARSRHAQDLTLFR